MNKKKKINVKLNLDRIAHYLEEKVDEIKAIEKMYGEIEEEYILDAKEIMKNLRAVDELETFFQQLEVFNISCAESLNYLMEFYNEKLPEMDKIHATFIENQDAIS